MTRSITLIDAHPDRERHHFVHALADAYAEGARGAGHAIRRIELAQLDFPVLRSPEEWLNGEMPPALREAADAIAWCQHLVLMYPLWLGDVPALLKAFLEQLARPGVAFRYRARGLPEKLWKGRSARIVVTMGMPGPLYRLFYRAHSLKSLERNVFGFVGIRPVHATVIGMVEGSDERRAQWLAELRSHGSAGD